MGISGLSQLPPSDNDNPEPRQGNHQGKSRSFCGAFCYVLSQLRQSSLVHIQARLEAAHSRFTLGQASNPFKIKGKWAAPLQVVVQRLNFLLRCHWKHRLDAVEDFKVDVLQLV